MVVNGIYCNDTEKKCREATESNRGKEKNSY